MASKNKGKKKAKVKVKKKKWLPIVAPKSFNNVKIGETHVAENQQAIGKVVKVNLMNLTGSYKKQNIVIRFDVNRVKDGQAYTYVTGFENTPSLIKRIVRKGRTKVEDSFLAKSADGFVVRVKPVVVTLNRAAKGAQTSIRLAVRDKLKKLLANTTFDKAVQELINYSFQKAVKEVASSFHPIKTVEIRHLSIVPASKKRYQEGLSDDSSKDAEELTEKEEAEKKGAEKEEVEESTDEGAEESTESAGEESPEDKEESPSEEKKANSE